MKYNINIIFRQSICNDKSYEIIFRINYYDKKYLSERDNARINAVS